MRILGRLFLTLAAIALPALAAPPVPAPHHPILGIWRLELPDGSCAETYRFRADGTTLVTSAEEVSESEFEILDAPSAKGFYRLVDRVVKGNGKQDCEGEVMQIGSTVTNFVRFHPTGTLFLMCASESLDSCIGPFRRVTGQGA